MARFNELELELPAWRDRTSVELVEQREDGAPGGSIVVLRTDFDKDLKPEALKEALEAGVRRDMPAGEVLKSELRHVDDHPAHFLDFTWRDGEGPAFRRVQLTVLNGRDSLMLVCTAPMDTYTRYAPVFERAANTLRLRGAERR